MKLGRRDFIRNSLLLGSSLLLSPASSRAVPKKEELWIPAYEKLEKEGKLAQRIKQAYAMFENCQLCPRRCGVNRKKGDKGFCRAPMKVVIFSIHPHFGEELSLVGQNGSGTIFFSNCNLRCIFCQNWPISHEGRGKECEDEELADMMIKLQKIGIAYHKGLRIPLVYNTSGYERLEILKILDGIVDIYMPDMKYTDSDKAAKYSAGASDYPEMAKKAIIEMNRQVGELQIDSGGGDREICQVGGGSSSKIDLCKYHAPISCGIQSLRISGNRAWDHCTGIPRSDGLG